MTRLALIGGAIVAPRAALRAVAGGPRGGVYDLLLLLAAQLVAVQLARLVVAVVYIVQISYSAGLSMLLNTAAQALLLPVVAMLVVAAALGPLTRGAPARERNLDVAALCVTPAVVLQLVASLAVAVAGVRPPRWVAIAVLAGGGAWICALLPAAVGAVRAAVSPSSSASPGAAPARATATGAAVGLVLLALVALNTFGVVRGWEMLRPVTGGRPAPLFSLERAEGGRVELASLRGKVVLLDFWASWCEPCVREMPLLATVQRELGPRGLQVVAVNTEGSSAKARGFAGRLGRDVLILVDDGETAMRYGVQTLPHQVVVGRDGRVRHVQVGGGGERTLRARLEQALAAR